MAVEALLTFRSGVRWAVYRIPASCVAAAVVGMLDYVTHCMNGWNTYVLVVEVELSSGDIDCQ
jgi:hypothetical protein